MEKAPKLETTVGSEKNIEDLTGAPDYKGGVTEETADTISKNWSDRGMTDKEGVAKITREIEAKMTEGDSGENKESSGSDLPEITAEIQRLRDEISNPKGGFFDKLKSRWASGVKKDTIELLKKGGRMVASQPDRFKMYKSLTDSGKKDLAIEFVLGLGQGKKIAVKDGEIINISGSQQKGGGILG